MDASSSRFMMYLQFLSYGKISKMSLFGPLLRKVPPVQGFGKQHLHIADIAFGEPTFTIAQIIFPHPNKCLGIAPVPDLINIGEKPSTPLPQGSGIVGRNIFQVEHSQIGRPGSGLADGRHRRDTAAREDIALDEIHGSSMAIEYMIADGDGLQRH